MHFFSPFSLLPRPFAPYLISHPLLARVYINVCRRGRYPASMNTGSPVFLRFESFKAFPLASHLFHHRAMKSYDGKKKMKSPSSAIDSKLELALFIQQRPFRERKKERIPGTRFSVALADHSFPSFPSRHRKVSDRRSRGNREEAAKIFARVEPRELRAPTACVSSVHPL